MEEEEKKNRDNFTSKKVEAFIKKKLDEKNGIFPDTKMEEASLQAQEYIDDEEHDAGEEELKVRPLTMKQEKFIKEWHTNGNDFVKAFRSVYKVTSTVAKEKCQELLEDPRVQFVIDNMNRIRRELEVIEKGEIVQSLKRLIVKCEQTGDKANLLKATDQLNKIAGFYAPEKQNNMLIQGTGDIQVSFGGWNPEESKKIETKDEQ
jgi:hypothetical protein